MLLPGYFPFRRAWRAVFLFKNIRSVRDGFAIRPARFLDRLPPAAAQAPASGTLGMDEEHHEKFESSAVGRRHEEGTVGSHR